MIFDPRKLQSQSGRTQNREFYSSERQQLFLFLAASLQRTPSIVINNKERKVGKRILLTLGILLLGTTWQALQARTADGETPTAESICDQLRAEGVTKGLYGLCIAFCEAQDLDFHPKSDHSGLEFPGAKLLEAYERKRGPDDPRMPCLVVASFCPCFNSALCQEVLRTTGQGQCQIDNLATIADAFPQQLCDNEDVCANINDEVQTRAIDRCSQGNPPLTTVVSVGITNKGNVCQVSITATEQEGPRVNRFFLDAETAEICLDELNEFDPENDTEPLVHMCGL